MSGTVLEAFKSDDVEFIQKTRAAYKGKLTRAANALINNLQKNNSGKFLYEEIIKEEVDSLCADLQQVKSIVDELHICYTIKRVHKEGAAENMLEELDNDYAAAFEETHRTAAKVYLSYCSLS